MIERSMATALSLTMAAAGLGCGGGFGDQDVPEPCQVSVDEAEDCNLGEVTIESVEDLEEMCETPCRRADKIEFIFFDDVAHVDGLNFLQEVEELTIDTTDIQTFSAMPELTDLQVLAIVSNSELTDVEPWEGITEMERFSVGGNDVLSDINVVPELTEVTDEDGTGSVGVSNSVVSDLSALSNLEVTDTLAVRFNDEITDLTGLESLKTINTSLIMQENERMSSLEGMEQLTEVGLAVRMERMENLRECEVESFIEGLEHGPENITLEDLSEEDC